LISAGCPILFSNNPIDFSYGDGAISDFLLSALCKGKEKRGGLLISVLMTWGASSLGTLNEIWRPSYDDRAAWGDEAGEIFVKF
jgi:hypothetical protein